jgi:hypothetical protein
MAPDSESRLVRVEERVSAAHEKLQLLLGLPLQVGKIQHDVDELGGRMRRGFEHIEKDIDGVRAEQAQVRREMAEQRKEDEAARERREQREEELRRSDFRARFAMGAGMVTIIVALLGLIANTFGGA